METRDAEFALLSRYLIFGPSDFYGTPKYLLCPHLKFCKLPNILLLSLPWSIFMLWILSPQVGIPIAAGMLLPVTGTMLTPSIAGALMGLSSVGVTTNSLLLRLKFMSKHNKFSGETSKMTIPRESDVLEQEDKLKHCTSKTTN